MAFGRRVQRQGCVPKYKVVAYDYGAKRNILRMLVERGCELTVVPAQTPASDVLAMKPDGVFLSNGPGDPEPCDYAIKAIQDIIAQKRADLRHLPRSPVVGAGFRRKNAEDEVRSPRCQPSGAGNGHQAGDDHQPEPRFCCG
jgi:hypothetical protein